MLEWSAEAVVAGRRRDGARRWRPEARRTGTVRPIGASPRRFRAPAGCGRRRGARGGASWLPGGRNRRHGAAAGGTRRRLLGEELGLGFGEAGEERRGSRAERAAPLSTGGGQVEGRRGVRHGGMAQQCVHWRHSEEDDRFAKKPLLLFSFFSFLYLFEIAVFF